jgi:hypothetical protein
MHVLAIGQGMPDPSVDNYNWASALSFFDYDALVIDPREGVSKFLDQVARGEGNYQTYDDLPVVEGYTSAGAVGLVDILRRRREETERFLARGGLIVCFAYPEVAHPDVLGFTGCHRYHWLPAPEGCGYGLPYVKSSSGRAVKVIDWEHPFANFLDSLEGVLYRASFAEGAAGFPGAKVIARSPGGAAIAIDVPVGGGRVIFIPAISPNILSSQRGELAGRLVAAIRNTLLTAAEGEPPDWVEEQALPGIVDARTRVEDVEAKLDELEAELDEARNAFLALDRYRRILWQEGKYGFELPVRDVLALLGATPYSQPDEPATFSMAMEPVMVEAESSTGEVGMEPHYRLRERLEARIAHDKRRSFGLVVVNGYRELPPAERPQQYSESLRIAAESMRYCVVTAGDLFAAVRDKLEGKGDAEAFLKRVVATEGVLAPAETATATESTASRD